MQITDFRRTSRGWYCVIPITGGVARFEQYDQEHGMRSPLLVSLAPSSLRNSEAWDEVLLALSDIGLCADPPPLRLSLGQHGYDWEATLPHCVALEYVEPRDAPVVWAA